MISDNRMQDKRTCAYNRSASHSLIDRRILLFLEQCCAFPTVDLDSA